MENVTGILQAIEHGDAAAAEELLPLVYDELRKLASQKLASEQPGQTLQATALVHEAYLRLVDVDKAQNWNSRGHFFAAAAEAMRRILIERARRRRRLRHGGDANRIDVDLQLTVANSEVEVERLLAINDALEQFATEEPEAAEVVKLRFFGGLSIQETAAVLHISARTVDRHWTYAKAWLYKQLHE